MIDAAPDRFSFWLPINSVIKRATSKERDGSQGKNSQSDSAPKFVGDCYKGQTGHQGDRGHDQMDQSAKFRLWQLGYGLGLEGGHGITIRRRAKKRDIWGRRVFCPICGI